METSAPPPGFSQADLGGGFGGGFGPVFLDRAGHRIGFRVGAMHLNPVGTCHGGALTTFADLGLMALQAGREAGLPHSPTVSLSVDFLSLARLDDWVEAEVMLLQRTQTLVFTQALMTVEGRAIARASAIYRNYGP